MIVKALMIGHLLGDFFFQSREIAEVKGEKCSMMALHCILYFASILAVSMIFLPVAVWGRAVGIWMGVSTIHGFIDAIKIKAERKCRILKNKGYLLFLAD